MDTLRSLLAGLPDDPTAALVLADYLEEQGDPRGELVRLTHALTRAHKVPRRAALEARLRALLYEQKVRPVVATLELEVGKKTSMTLAWVPPGRFRMGSPTREPGREETEKAHEVALTRGFWLGVYPVTQAQWRALMRTNPSANKGNERPVDNISWEMASRFCERLGRRCGRAVRLPSEAEWEYACRAGTSTAYHFGRDLTPGLARYEARYGEAENQGTSAVGSYPPNAFGLYDMHGNVYEWVADRWDADYYENCPAEDPPGPEGADDDPRLLRGGSWFYDADSARSAHRIECSVDYGYVDMGFRVACDRD